MRAARAVTFAILSLSLHGCVGHRAPEVELAIETEHFRYYVQTDRPHCDGVTAWLEHYAMSLERMFGTSPGKIDYYLYSDTASLEAAGCPATGCATQNRIRTIFPVHTHEIVHSFARPRGHPPHLFVEGLAGVFGCMSDQAPTSMAPLEEILTTDGFDNWDGGQAYPTSASFVRHLLDRHGMGRFLTLYSRLPHDGSRAVIASIFAEVLGATLDDEIQRWRDNPPAQACDWQIECAMMPLKPKRTVDVELMCGRTGATAELAFRADVPKAGVVQLQLSGAAPRDVLVQRCTGGTVHASGVASDGVYEVPLVQDSYLVRIRGDHAQRQYRLRWSQVDAGAHP